MIDKPPSQTPLHLVTIGETFMTTRRFLCMMPILVALTWAFPAWAEPPAPDQPYQASPKSLQRQRNEIRAMRAQTLRKLQQLEPGSRQALSRATGYAVFKHLGTQVLVAGGSVGEGILHDNRTGQDTYMKMAGLAAGPGVGFRDQRLVFVFSQREVLERFVQEGWLFGGQADAAAKLGDRGAAEGAMQTREDIKIYQITENGLTLQVSLQGSKFWPDETLNSKHRKAAR
ncbi:hypothetical protein CCP4SC76_4440002 [Gammaproteobacteria bacterium]